MPLSTPTQPPCSVQFLLFLDVNIVNIVNIGNIANIANIANIVNIGNIVQIPLANFGTPEFLRSLIFLDPIIF